jgi:formate dehydrogenase major subunit
VKLRSWLVIRQLTEGDPLGLGKAARSQPTSWLVRRTRTTEHVVKSVCPYSTVGGWGWGSFWPSPCRGR